ncbi:hypothetical protein BDR07DRAFT_1265941 [Suillus spraguei]|nr:hypothetical protein BDR07DRAFT_1265941 [Suillus spraguei]
MTTTLGLRSPVLRSGAVSPQAPRPAFDTEVLRAYVKKLLPATLSHAVWPHIERDQVKTWMKEIGERVKERMVEVQPHGFKYMVLVQITENLGQGGRSHMVSHWEDGDVCLNELFFNDSLFCTCTAIVVRAS